MPHLCISLFLSPTGIFQRQTNTNRAFFFHPFSRLIILADDFLSQLVNLHFIHFGGKELMLSVATNWLPVVIKKLKSGSGSVAARVVWGSTSMDLLPSDFPLLVLRQRSWFSRVAEVGRSLMSRPIKQRDAMMTPPGGCRWEPAGAAAGHLSCTWISYLFSVWCRLPALLLLLCHG